MTNCLSWPLTGRLIRMLLFQAGMIVEAVVSPLDDLAPFTQCHNARYSFPNSRFPIVLLSRPPKWHGDLDFASEGNMVMSKWERLIPVAKVPGNLKMGTPNPISPVTQTSERLDHRYCTGLITSSSNTCLWDTYYNPSISWAQSLSMSAIEMHACSPNLPA